MTSAEIEQKMETLNDEWQYIESERRLHRHFKFKGFAKAAQVANICVWLAEEQNHHPDVTFGWGYVKISLTSHDVGQLSERDFRWARSLDQILASTG